MQPSTSTPIVTETDDKPASVAETLRAARALIQDPEHWIQGRFAQTDARSVSVSPSNPEATAWCLVGALRRVDGPYERDALKELAETIEVGYVSSLYPADRVIDFNDADRRRHQDVIRMLDRAIAKAEARS